MHETKNEQRLNTAAARQDRMAKAWLPSLEPPMDIPEDVQSFRIRRHRGGYIVQFFGYDGGMGDYWDFDFYTAWDYALGGMRASDEYLRNWDKDRAAKAQPAA